MKKRFVQRERSACFVSTTREVMASTRDEAEELFDNGEGGAIAIEVGEMLSMGVVESSIDQEDGPARATSPLSTSDIGIAIRDMLEGRDFHAYDLVGDDAFEREETVRVDHVDVSDPHNPIVHTEDGHRYRLTITVI